MARSDLSKDGNPPTKARRSKESRRIWLAIIFLALLGGCLLGYWALFMRVLISSDDARLDADRVDLAPDLSGRLERLLVAEGDWVERGQAVFALDQTLFQAALAMTQVALEAARFALAEAQAQLAKVLHGSTVEEIQIAQDAEKQAKARATLTKADYDRTAELYKKSAVTGERLDKARTAWSVAENAWLGASHRLALLRRGARQEDIDVAKARADAADAHLRAAQVAVDKTQTDLKHTLVLAPFSGHVVRVWRFPGAMLAPGTPVVTLVDPARLYVAANIDEKDLDKISVGDRVDISIDAFPEHALVGKVSRILRATNSTFSLIPAEGVSGTFIKVTQRVPIRIVLDALPKLPLGPGLSVEVHIHVNEGRGLAHVGTPAAGNKPAQQTPSDRPTGPVDASTAHDGA